VLFGQPELDVRLAHESVRQLRQRITFQTKLSALTPAEVELYVAHRLRIAGHCDGRLFDPGAVRALHRASGGVPRLVNILAHKAMLLAFGEGVHTIAAKHVRGARADTPAARPERARWWWLGFAMMLASAGTCARCRLCRPRGCLPG